MDILNNKSLLRICAFICIAFPGFWLLLPNLAILVYNPSVNSSLKIIGLLFTIISTIPIFFLVSKNLRQFWLWNMPFAIIAGLYAVFISQCHDIPYDGMWFALWNTSVGTLSGLTHYFSRDVMLAIAGFVGYCFCLLHPIQKRILLSKKIKQQALLLSILTIFLCLFTTNFLSRKIAVQRVIE